MIGIYCITNIINGKKYIGQSSNIRKRWNAHKENYLKKEKNTKLLYQAIRKYGLENFKFEIIEECSPEILNEREIYWIEYYQTYPPTLNKGYNLTPGGEQTSFRKLNIENLNNIIKDLKYSNLNQEEIAKKYNVDQAVISNINTGYGYNFYIKEKFPLRNREQKRKNIVLKPPGKNIIKSNPISDETLNNIITDLQDLILDQASIIHKYKINKNDLAKINNGTIRPGNYLNINYPIRSRGSLISKSKKIPMPPYEELFKSFYELRNKEKVAQRYNVSSPVLKKWCNKYGINPQRKNEYIEKYEVEFLGKEPKKKIKHKYNDVVIQLDIHTGKIIAEYRSKNIAGKSVGGTGVGLANALKKGKPYMGFKWELKYN